MRVALVEKHGHPDSRRQLQVGFQRPLLVGARREVAVEVEPGLPDGDDLGLRRQALQCRRTLRAPLLRVVRMDARGGEQHARRRPGDAERGHALRLARAGNHDLRHARFPRACKHLLTIAIERFVAKIRADVDEFHVKPPDQGADRSKSDGRRPAPRTVCIPMCANPVSLRVESWRHRTRNAQHARTPVRLRRPMPLRHPRNRLEIHSPARIGHPALRPSPNGGLVVCHRQTSAASLHRRTNPRDPGAAADALSLPRFLPRPPASTWPASGK